MFKRHYKAPNPAIRRYMNSEEIDKTEGVYNKITISVPKNVHDILKQESINRGLPISRLASYAVYFASKDRTLFDFERIDCDLEDINDWDDPERGAKAKRVLNFINKFDHYGINIDYLFMCSEMLEMEPIDVARSIKLLKSIDKIGFIEPGKRYFKLWNNDAFSVVNTELRDNHLNKKGPTRTNKGVLDDIE